MSQSKTIKEFRDKINSAILKENGLEKALEIFSDVLNPQYKLLLIQEAKVLKFMKKWHIEMLYSTIAGHLECKFCRMFHTYLAGFYVKDTPVGESDHSTEFVFRKALENYIESGRFDVHLKEDVKNFSKLNIFLQIGSNAVEGYPFVEGMSEEVFEEMPFELDEIIDIIKLTCLFVPIALYVHNTLDLSHLMDNNVEVLSLAKEHYEKVTGVTVENISGGE